jgi:hypothetical protein
MEAMPAAVICHRTSQRIRVKIPAKRGDKAFFTALAEHFEKWDVDLLKANPISGSVLVVCKNLDVESFQEEAKKNGFFKLSDSQPAPIPVVKTITGPIQSTSAFFKKLTGGDTDLAGIIFLALLLFGIYELMRGNFRTPPWYTAFWYAFGLFSKSLADEIDHID